MFSMYRIIASNVMSLVLIRGLNKSDQVQWLADTDSVLNDSIVQSQLFVEWVFNQVLLPDSRLLHSH